MSAQTRSLWDEYQGTKERKLFDQLVELYLPLVHQIALHYGAKLPSSVTSDDVVSYGYMGLMDAIRRFDPERLIQFETYAASRIRGAIIDELRSNDWVPRSVRKAVRQMDDVVNELTQRFGRSPSDAETAEILEMSEEEVSALRQSLSSSNPMSLDATRSDSESDDQWGSGLSEILADDQGTAVPPSEQILKQRLVDAIYGLEDRESIVVTLHYYQGMSLMQIGELLGVSESRVGQLHTHAMAGVREWLRPS